jgi:hypothetical protein
MLEESDGALMIRVASMTVQPSMQCGTDGEDCEQHDQRRRAAGQQAAKQWRKDARAELPEDHNADGRN